MTDTVKQIIFTSPVNKKNPWFIPIEKVGNRYMTGQDLTADKMINPDKMTEEERKKYPYVLSPENVYQVKHLAKFDISKPYDQAIYNLIIQSQKVAKSESEYKKKPITFVGYFFDKELDAITGNDLEDDIYEASTLVRKAPMEHYSRIATILNYMIKGNFYIPVKTSSGDIIKSKLLKACRTNPEDVKKCFPKHNPGIENYSFILELLDYTIIRETTRGEFFYEKEFLGSSVDDVIAKLAKRDGYELKQVLESSLGSKKTGVKVKDKKTPDNFQKELMQLKSFLFDGKTDKFVSGIEQLYNEYPEFTKSHEFADDMDMLDKKLKEITDPTKGSEPKPLVSKKQEAKKETPKPELIKEKVEEKKPPVTKKVEVKSTVKKPDMKYGEELFELELEKLQNKVKHPRTPFKVEDCKAFFDDKDKLVEYMVSVKFPVNA